MSLFDTLNPFSKQNTQNINFDPYGPVGALKQAGSTVGDALKGSILDPGRGNETLAAAYAQAQQQAAALSDLQWQRQMQGLQGALGHVGQQQSLWNSVYGGPPGGAAPGPNLGSPPFTMPAPGGGQLRPDYITPGHAPNTNPDFQSILDRLNAAGGPQGRATTENTFGSPNPAGSPPGTTWQMPSANTSNPMVTSASGGGGGVASSASPGGGISMQQGALSASPPPLTYGTPRPTPVAATASRGLDSYLSPPPAPTPSLAVAAPSLSSFIAPPAAPPPPAPASAALPGLADFIPVTGGGMSPMLRKVGWGGL